MTIYYSLSERKPLVKALEQITGVKSIYKGIKICAYEVGSFTVTREGNLKFDDCIDRSEAEVVLWQLEAQGFRAENSIAEHVSEACNGFENNLEDRFQ